MEEESVKLSRSRDRKNKLSMNTNKSSQADKLSQRSSSSNRNKPSLIDLNINMNSLNDMLKNIIDTINQHAVLLNNISSIWQQKFDKTSFKVLYKNSFTKELVHKWQNLSNKDDIRNIDRTGAKEKDSLGSAIETVPKPSPGYTVPLGVEYKKHVADVRINKEVVEAEKLLKEYLYLKEFPDFIVQAALRLNDDIKYVHELTKQNRERMHTLMDEFRTETQNNSKVFEKSVEDKIEVLHQDLLQMKSEQTKFWEDTDVKIEQVEKNTLWKIRDYEELLKTRPNKEFVRDTTKMECDKIKSFCVKEFNNHIPKLERQINTTKEKFDFLSDDLVQKVSKMQADVNILKEGLNLSQSTCMSQYRSMKENLKTKFENFELHMNECKEKDKTKFKRLNQLEADLKELMENPKINQAVQEAIDEEQLKEITDLIKADFDRKLVRGLIFN